MLTRTDHDGVASPPSTQGSRLSPWGRDPASCRRYSKCPAHAHRLRSTPDINKGNTAVGPMHGNALKLIHKKRATLAPLFPVGTEHEMIHGELCLSVKQVH